MGFVYVSSKKICKFFNVLHCLVIWFWFLFKVYESLPSTCNLLKYSNFLNYSLYLVLILFKSSTISCCTSSSVLGLGNNVDVIVYVIYYTSFIILVLGFTWDYMQIFADLNMRSSMISERKWNTGSRGGWNAFCFTSVKRLSLDPSLWPSQFTRYLASIFMSSSIGTLIVSWLTTGGIIIRTNVASTRLLGIGWLAQIHGEWLVFDTRSTSTWPYLV